MFEIALEPIHAIMHVTRIATTEDLERLKPNWNFLAHGMPFRTWQWLFNWWKHYGDGKKLYTLAVHDDGGVLVGVAPWFIETRGNDGLVIQFLGSGEVCTDYLTILATTEYARAVSTAIAEWLVRATRGHVESEDQWDLLDLEAVLVGDANIEILLSALQINGCTSNRCPALNCWRLALPSSWDEFTSGLKKAHAKKIRKVSRQLFDSGRGVIRNLDKSTELEERMRVFVDLHQLRWTSLGEPGCFASRQFDSFLHDSAADLFAAQMLGISCLEIEGQPVAIEFFLSSAAARYVYQGGLDPRALKESPGHATMSRIIRDAIQAGCQYLDFLRGDESYKATWGARPMRTEHIRVAADRLGPRLRNQAWFAGQTMKGWIKQGLTLTGVH
ncbi:MAG: GNAT family N-acetyltransferase [Pirellulaceae bacterium]|nr:GNAT family N-acetyltransferase [Pirellulaceae bacterium]